MGKQSLADTHSLEDQPGLYCTAVTKVNNFTRIIMRHQLIWLSDRSHALGCQAITRYLFVSGVTVLGFAGIAMSPIGKGVAGNVFKAYPVTSRIVSGSHGTRHLTVFSLFFAALAVILVHLLILVEGGSGRACPGIANLTTIVTPYAAELVSDTFGDKVPVNAIVALGVTFRKIGQSVCDCRLHQIDNDRAKLKAQVKDCECPVLCILCCNLFSCRQESQTRQVVMVIYLNTAVHLGFLRSCSRLGYYIKTHIVKELHKSL